MASTIQNDLLKERINTVVLKSLIERDKESQEVVKELEQRSSGQFKIRVQTLNSCLQKLEKEGLVLSYLDAPTGRSKKERKLYSITDSGKQVYTRSMMEYEYSRSIADKLLSDRSLNLNILPPLAPAPPKARRPRPKQVDRPIDYYEAHKIDPNASNLDLKLLKNQQNINDNILSTLQPEIAEQPTLQDDSSQFTVHSSQLLSPENNDNSQFSILNSQLLSPENETATDVVDDFENVQASNEIVQDTTTIVDNINYTESSTLSDFENPDTNNYISEFDDSLTAPAIENASPATDDVHFIDTTAIDRALDLLFRDDVNKTLDNNLETYDNLETYNNLETYDKIDYGDILPQVPEFASDEPNQIYDTNTISLDYNQSQAIESIQLDTTPTSFQTIPILTPEEAHIQDSAKIVDSTLQAHLSQQQPEALVENILKHSQVSTELADKYYAEREEKNISQLENSSQYENVTQDENPENDTPQFEYNIDYSKTSTEEERRQIIASEYKRLLADLIVEPQYDDINNQDYYQQPDINQSNTISYDTTFENIVDESISAQNVYKTSDEWLPPINDTTDFDFDANDNIATQDPIDTFATQSTGIVTAAQIQQQVNIQKYETLSKSVAQLEKGIVVKPHNDLQSKEYKFNNYFYKNRLMDRQFSLLFVAMLVEIALSFVFVNLVFKAEQKGYILYYLGSLILCGALPIYAAVCKYNRPDIRKRFVNSFKTYMTFRIVICAELVAVIILLNMAYGLNIHNISQYAVSTIIPIIMALNIPLSAYLFRYLYTSKKYAVQDN